MDTKSKPVSKYAAKKQAARQQSVSEAVEGAASDLPENWDVPNSIDTMQAVTMQNAVANPAPMPGIFKYMTGLVWLGVDPENAMNLVFVNKTPKGVPLFGIIAIDGGAYKVLGKLPPDLLMKVERDAAEALFSDALAVEILRYAKK